MQPLGQMVGTVCRESGVVVRSSINAANQITYQMTTPTDRSASVLLTDQGDLKALSQLVTPSNGTHVIAAGQGELTARAFAVADSGAIGLDRVEDIYESTNIATASGLISAAESQLDQRATDISVDGEVADDAAQRVRYLDTYDLGDWLGVEIDGVRYSSQVETVRFQLGSMSQSVVPVLGRTSVNRALQLRRAVSSINSQLSRSIS